MKCFEVVQRVLEDTYNEVPGDEGQRDDAIRTALKGMSPHYKHNLLTKGGPDFTCPVNRFAYVYCYVPTHAHWVYELIKWSKDVQQALRQDKVRVACIGGGPGSDVVGLLKFLDERGDPPALFCEIVDGCELWKQTWSDLAFTLDWPAPLNTDYIVHTVGADDVWNRPHKFRKADIFTLNFFVSEITVLGDAAKAYITEVFSLAKPGALFLFNDNNDSRFRDSFDALAAGSGLEVLLSNQGTRKVYDHKEQITELGRFLSKFDHNPRLTGDVAWRVLRKPE